MINASALFNALPPFSEGTDAASAGTPAGSAADAFAALLAGLDPAGSRLGPLDAANLQTTLGAPVAPANVVPLEETTATLPEVGEAAASLAPIPILLDVHAAGLSRTAGQKLPSAGRAEEEEEEALAQESFVDPLAFLLSPALVPVVDRVALVPLSVGSAIVIPEETQAGAEAVPSSTDADADAPTEVALSVALIETETATAPLDAQDAEAPQRTPALTLLPKTTERVSARESGESPQSPPARTDNVERRPIDLRQTLDEASRTARTTESVPGDRPAPDIHGQQEIPREGENVTPLNVEGRWVQAVKRFVAQSAAAADTQTDTRNTSALPAERNTLIENARGNVERLASLAQSPESQSGSHDQQASQRGTAGLLAAHGPQFVSSATSAVEFALPSAAPEAKDAPLPEDGDLARQIVQAAHLQWRNGGGDARLTLQPEYLGEVEISIRVESGTVTATMKAADPEVRAWMQSHETLLKQGLAEQGLRLDKLHVYDERDERERGQDRQREPRDQPYRPQPPRGTPPVFELTV